MGIFLVVLGHLNRSFINADIVFNYPIINFVDRWIYSFHMPLFFFVSGLFFMKLYRNNLLMFSLFIK